MPLRLADFKWQLMCFLQWGSWFSCSFPVYSSMDKGSKLLHCRWLEAMVCKWSSWRV